MWLQELNKLRKAALCYSFFDLLESMATMLERECEKANPEGLMQLRHAAAGLRAAPGNDLNRNIVPVLE